MPAVTKHKKLQLHSPRNKRLKLECDANDNGNNNNNDNNIGEEEVSKNENNISYVLDNKNKKNDTCKTVILFDWDDTLIASSHLAASGYTLDGSHAPNEMINENLKLLEIAVNAVIQQALQLGEVHIVTNAEKGWVELSCRRFLPNCWSLISGIKVVSARSIYESAYPDEPVQWKVCAFQDKLEACFNDKEQIKNILAFGDSNCERQALQIASENFNNVLLKNIKFVERPTIEQLTRELEFVGKCLHYVFEHDKTMDLMLKCE